MNDRLNKLNCMNYHVADSDDNIWFAQNGLRSLYEYSKIGTMSFRTICLLMLDQGEITITDIRNNDNEKITLTMI